MLDISAENFYKESPKVSDVIAHILEARREASMRDIEANAILINDRLYQSHFFSYSYERVDMICGLKCIYVDDLPGHTTFAVTHLSNLPDGKDEKIKKLEAENEELKNILSNIREIIGSEE